MAASKLTQLPKDTRLEIWEKVKVYYETGLSYTDIIDNIEHIYNAKIDRAGISRKAKKDNWIKGDKQQLKNDIIEYEKEKTTLDNKKTTLTNKVAQLNDFEITTLDELVQDETKLKSLIFNTTILNVVRTNEHLTNNKKVEIVKLNNYADGRLDSQSVDLVEVGLGSDDFKHCQDTLDKASITLGINQRHATQSAPKDNDEDDDRVIVAKEPDI